jgi:succinate dehydrogenase hydrophobic anchor subunit
MNVVYREISAVFLHPYKTYVLSVEFSVMNVVYREICAAFLHPTKHITVF